MPKLKWMQKKIAGERIGSLTAIEPVRSTGNGIAWRWKCDCGLEKVATIQQARATSHCGCQTKRKQISMSTTHGGSKTPAYNSWANMVARCTRPSCRAYKYYGGRGIAVCERWHHSFKNFIQDVGYPPREGMSIDRIDNNGNYEPGNCRWATRPEQMANRRNAVMVLVDGQLMCQHEACNRLGLAWSSVRIAKRRGLTAQQAVDHVRNNKEKREMVHHS